MGFFRDIICTGVIRSLSKIYSPEFIGKLTGNADSASKLATARNIALTGSVTGNANFDGSGNISISTSTNHSHNYAGSSSAGGSATSADMISGFSRRNDNQTWGVQTGTFIFGMDDATGGSIAYRRDCPIGGQLSQIIDGFHYQNEGRFRCLDESDSSSFAAANHSHSYLPLSGGIMTGSIITPKNDNMGIIPDTNNYGQIGSSDKKFYRMYATTFYGNLNGKLSNARTIALDGAVTGSVSFDGSANVTITNKVAYGTSAPSSLADGKLYCVYE